MNTKLKKNNKKNKKEKIYEEPKQIKELNESNNECFICLEIYCNDENTIKLNESKYYSKLCDCNLSVHNVCLDNWYSKSCYVCPICRKYIFTDIYQYHYPTNEEPVNEEPVNEESLVNQNDTIFFKLIKICIFLLSLHSFLYLLLKQTQKESGFAY